MRTGYQVATVGALFASILSFEYYLIDSVSTRLDSLEEVISTNAASASSLSLETEAIGGDDIYSERDLECLALNAYFESLNEPTAGKIGVTHVVLNRVESARFPNTVCGVIYQGQTYTTPDGRRMPLRNRCQFSWYCDGRSDIPRAWKRYTEIYQLVAKVATDRAQGVGNDITKGSLFYHADYVDPHWNRRINREVQLGRHIFYTMDS